jgi:signal transduction histidine kinase
MPDPDPFADARIRDALTFDVLEGNIQLLAEKERLEHERQRLELRDRLKTEFLARVSHDLRTPLNSIIGFSELLLAEAAQSGNRKQNEYLEAIHRNGYALLALITDLLDLASIESGQFQIRPEPIDLAVVLDDVRAATEPQLTVAAAAVSWPDRAALAGRTALLDRRRICQAIINLVDNARKHTQAGGRVAIEITDDERETRFAVSDAGPGVAEEDRERILASFFQRDQTGHQRGAGVGLGLAIVRGIVERHGGRVELDSQPGRGARFLLVIPRRNP